MLYCICMLISIFIGTVVDEQYDLITVCWEFEIHFLCERVLCFVCAWCAFARLTSASFSWSTFTVNAYCSNKWKVKRSSVIMLISCSLNCSAANYRVWCSNDLCFLCAVCHLFSYNTSSAKTLNCFGVLRYFLTDELLKLLKEMEDTSRIWQI